MRDLELYEETYELLQEFMVSINEEKELEASIYDAEGYEVFSSWS